MIRWHAQFFCIRFFNVFCHNSAAFYTNCADFFIGAQETFIYRLVLRNPSYAVSFPFLNFWVTFGGKWSCPRHAPNGMGLQRPPKNWPSRWTFWISYYLGITFSEFWGVTPSPIRFFFQKSLSIDTWTLSPINQIIKKDRSIVRSGCPM